MFFVRILMEIKELAMETGSIYPFSRAQTLVLELPVQNTLSSINCDPPGRNKRLKSVQFNIASRTKASLDNHLCTCKEQPPRSEDDSVANVLNYGFYF